jgi:hypothetical protein
MFQVLSLNKSTENKEDKFRPIKYFQKGLTIQNLKVSIYYLAFNFNSERKTYIYKKIHFITIN